MSVFWIRNIILQSKHAYVYVFLFEKLGFSGFLRLLVDKCSYLVCNKTLKAKSDMKIVYFSV